MKIKVVTLLDHCIDTGIRHGITHAFKYTETPNEEIIIESISNAIHEQLWEFFYFEDDTDE